jgi:hypothetical protein
MLKISLSYVVRWGLEAPQIQFPDANYNRRNDGHRSSDNNFFNHAITQPDTMVASTSF